MSPAVRDLLAIGRIVKAFGIRGDVIVQPMTDDSKRFLSLKRVYLGRFDDAQQRTGTEAVETTVVHVQVDPRGVRLRLTAIPDRTAAEKSVGLLVLVGNTERVPLAEGRFFVHELIGVTVRTEEGEVLGVLTEVLRMPAQDVYVVKGEGGEFMIPAVEAFVRAVDVSARTMTVRLIEGMRG
ncbi:MAG: rRNA processing protein RimM [Bacteroidetes bacterium]|nr:rRNA processing protein RimM [Bacteroidota bacterium]